MPNMKTRLVARRCFHINTSQGESFVVLHLAFLILKKKGEVKYGTHSYS